MKRVYLLSVCEKVIPKKAKYLVYFHFKGAYLGERIHHVAIESKVKLMRNEDYFLSIEVIRVYRGVLVGRLLRYKLID